MDDESVPTYTYAQALELWEEKYVTALMAKGWTRTDIDKGFRGKPDGTMQRMVSPRPRKAEGVKTEKEWFAIA